jgi:cell division protease FtsH
MSLHMTDEALQHAVRRTGEYVPGAASGTRYSGDHLNALCRAVARLHLCERDTETPSVAETSPEDVERAITLWTERPDLSENERRVVATHEAGHAITSLFCPHAPPIERISIQGDAAGALGFVRYQDATRRYVVTRGELLDDICVLMGGREAEQLLLDDLSIGSAQDLQRATAIARALVEEFGMGGEEVGVVRFHHDTESRRRSDLSEEQLRSLDRRVREVLEESRQRCIAILSENLALVETLRDLLLEKRIIDAKNLK